MAVERFDQSPSSPSGEHSPAPPSPLPTSLKGTLTARETIPPENLPDSDDDQNMSDAAETSAGRIGRYQLIGILGQGAMGIVYLAHDPDNQRQVALKLPKFGSTSGADNVELLQRFYREARATGNLDHPNICRVYDVGQSDGTHYIAMAYIAGRSLSDYLDQQELMPQPQAAMLIRKLADALQHAHGRGVVHRDLKPGNIMLDARGEPIVMDFGLACETAVTGDIRLTQSGSILGSPAYMSPEQADGQIKKVGPLSDLYSLGVILYELLTGQLPFRGSIAAVLAQILTRNPRPPSELRPDVDSQLESICLKMMAKKPSDRFASMQQVVEALDGYLTWAAPATRSLGLRPELVGTESQPTNRAPAAVSVVASLADEQLVKARQCQQAIARARREGNLEQAIRYLKQLATSKSARITDYVRWAQQELPKVEAELDRVQREAREQCAAACEKARTLMQDHDYAGALQALELVPVTARGNEHAQLLSEVTELADECSSLRQEIDDAVKRKKYDRLAPLVRRFLKLKPDNPKMERLLRDLAKNRPARAVAKFRGDRKYLDVAGRLVEPKELALSVIGILALFMAMSYFVRGYLANRNQAAVAVPLAEPEAGPKPLVVNAPVAQPQPQPVVAPAAPLPADIGPKPPNSEAPRDNRPAEPMPVIAAVDATVNANRAVAEWVIKNGGSLVIGELHVTDVASLANSLDNNRGGILRINLSGVENVPDGILVQAAKSSINAMSSIRLRNAEVALFSAIPAIEELTFTAVSEGVLMKLPPKPSLRKLGFFNGAEQLTANGVAALKQFPNLQAVEVNQGQFNDDSLARFADLTNVNDLTLTDTRVTDAGLVHLEKMINLEKLQLYYNSQIAGSGIQHLVGLAKLRVLKVSLGSIGDSSMEYIGKLSAIEELHLNRGKLTDDKLGILKNLKALRELSLAYSSVTNQGLRELAQLEQLETLICDNTKIDDTGLKSLTPLKNLKTLGLKSTIVSAKAVADFRAAVSGCTVDVYPRYFVNAQRPQTKDSDGFFTLLGGNKAPSGWTQRQDDRLLLEEVGESEYAIRGVGLETVKRYGTFELEVDFKGTGCRDWSNSEIVLGNRLICFRTDKVAVNEPPPNFKVLAIYYGGSAKGVPLFQAAQGEWHRLRVRNEMNALIVQLDEEKPIACPLPQLKGGPLKVSFPVSLFRQIRVRELK